MKKRLSLKAAALAAILTLAGCNKAETITAATSVSSDNLISETEVSYTTTAVTSEKPVDNSAENETLKYSCMGIDLKISDKLEKHEIKPVLNEENGLYVIENAAVIRKPLDFFAEKSDSDFDEKLSEYEKSLDEWELVLTDNSLGNMTVSNASVYFKKYADCFYLFAEELSLKGNVTLSGLLYCEPLSEGKNPNLYKDSLVFYPYPNSLIENELSVIPSETAIRNNDEYIFAADTLSLYLGDINDISAVQKEWFADNNYADVNITFSDIILSFAQAQTGEAKSYAKVISASLTDEIPDATTRTAELSVKERIRQLSDNNIRLMDINTRKYSQTYYEVAPDGSYAIYEFDEIDTYSEYIELMYDTYTRDVADIFIYNKYGFDSLEDRLAVYSERNITIINNVHWEDYQFEIISLNDTECVFECTSWHYIDNYVSNGKEYTTHKCTAVKCEDGKWRLSNSFF